MIWRLSSRLSPVACAFIEDAARDGKSASQLARLFEHRDFHDLLSRCVAWPGIFQLFAIVVTHYYQMSC
jgi:hypothetical protein